MNCPVCGSEITAGSKYCPVCGTDVEGAQMRARQAAAPTAQQPPVQQRPAAPQGRAVPMNSSMPPQAAGRGFDTSKMGGSPKWPIVLIVVLVIVIVAVLLLIFKPWEALNGGTDAGQPATTVTATVGDAQANAGDAQQAVQTGQVSEPVQEASQPTTLSDAEAYAQLTSSYEQLDGMHQQISSVAADFSNQIGVGDMTDVRARAAEVQSQVAAAAAALDALDIAADSPYAATKSAIAELYNDLAMRIEVLVEACDADLAGQDYGVILSRDNGSPDEHGHTNVYLIHYEQNYEAARPAAPQA